MTDAHQRVAEVQTGLKRAEETSLRYTTEQLGCAQTVKVYGMAVTFHMHGVVKQEAGPKKFYLLPGTDAGIRRIKPLSLSSHSA